MIDYDSAFVEFSVNYEQTKYLAGGKAVHSDAISAGGHMWKINLYPNGFWEVIRDKSYEHLYIELELLSKPNSRVNSILGLLAVDKDGQPDVIAVTKTCHSQMFRAVKRKLSSGTNLIEKFLKDGQIKFLCTISVFHGNSSISVPPSDIGKHLGTLLDTADGKKDVSFTIDGETFHAHRVVLAARSTVFKAELGSMAEATMPSITLHDIAPATFKVMLRFMYTDTLPGDDEIGDSPAEMFERLLAAADRYALDRLKLLCAKKLWDNVSVDTVATTLACAETYSCPELKHKCISFFAMEKNFKKAVLTEGFVKLVQ
ncbi:unnamed protein product [Urochloa decumbens]|uniref:BTB domain-containing protein n=1 Tax=Urochloa decumbens TaxID=240449 RepID=A0ABC9BNV4_9POAL